MLEGTTAFVTGASQGIGRAIAVRLAEEGADVALAARGDGIHGTADRIGDDARTLPIETDVTDEASVREAIDATVEAFGGLDCLVNNAGIAGPTAPIEDVSVEEWQRTQDVNVLGTFLCTKHAVPHLRESDRPRVINISSISGKRPLPTRAPYAASKMAVIGLTRTLAFELDDPITVNAVCPGPVEGDRLDRVIQNQAEQLGVSPAEAADAVFRDDQALDEFARPDEIAAMVAYLAGDRARHVTAQDISVDSGATWY